MSASCLSSLCLGLLVGCAGGDSNPPTYPVTGTVTYKGQPADGATVILVPISAEAKGATGTTDAEGKFTMTTFVNGDGARPGDYAVKVFKYEFQDPGPTEAEMETNTTLEEEEEMYDPDAESEAPPAKNLLPQKYASETTSGFKHTVTEEPTTLDLDLK